MRATSLLFGIQVVLQPQARSTQEMGVSLLAAVYFVQRWWQELEKLVLLAAVANIHIWTAGQINTNEIYIMNGNNCGLSMGQKRDCQPIGRIKTSEGQITSYNTNKFVRFDHNGLYGCNWPGEDKLGSLLVLDDI